MIDRSEIPLIISSHSLLCLVLGDTAKHVAHEEEERNAGTDEEAQDANNRTQIHATPQHPTDKEANDC